MKNMNLNINLMLTVVNTLCIRPTEGEFLFRELSM
jgi:hypothetical protein